ncbi:MAG: VOC family protein [Vicinamibacterales bacterium]
MHAIHWFEIPTADLTRAKAFYSTMLGFAVSGFRDEQGGPLQMAVFPYDNTTHGVGGALIHGGPQKPAANGVIIYLNAGQDLKGAVERALNIGGQLVQPITDIGEPGQIALIQDLEGNIVGLHQPPAGRQN